jgi:aspartate aminotransferase-like enzyme
LIGEEATQAPHVITIELPPHIASAEVARTLKRAGFLVAHASAYLRDRNWIQLCLMGEVPREALPALLRELGRCVDGPVS